MVDLNVKVNFGVPRVPTQEMEFRAGYQTDNAFPAMDASHWSAVDEPSINGDTIRLEVLALPDTELLCTQHYQVELNGRVLDVGMGPFPNEVDRFFGNQPPFDNSIRIRPIMRPKCGLIVDDYSAINNLDTITDAKTGATAVVVRKYRDKGDNVLIVRQATGQFGAGNAIQVGGVTRTAVGTNAIFKEEIHISGSSREIIAGETVDTSSGGSFFVNRVLWNGGTAEKGDWSALLIVDDITGSITFGDTLSVDGTPCGAASNWPLRPYSEHREIVDGVFTDKAGPWSSSKTISCTIGTPTVTITANRGNSAGEAIAPAGILFYADAKGFSVKEPRKNLRYKWTFDETGDWGRMRADFPWGRERSIAYGPGQQAFTFETPGDHTVTCECIDETTAEVVASGSITVTVDDPETVYAGSNTVTVAASGADYTSLDAAITAINASAGSSPHRRIHLEGGETFSTWTKPSGTLSSLQICTRPGSSGDAIVAVAMEVDTGAAIDDVVIHKLKFSQGYDPSLLTMQDTPGDGVALGGLAGALTVHNCDLTGVGTAISFTGPGYPTVVTNCFVSDWWDYGLQQGDLGPCGIFGVSVIQNSQTLQLGQSWGSHKYIKTPVAVANHGCIRLSRPRDRVSVDMFDAMNNGNWTGSGAGGAQPVLRFFDGARFPTEISFTRLAIEAGGFGLFAAGNPAARGLPEKTVYDKVIFIGLKVGSNVAAVTTGGGCIKNALIVLEDKPTEDARAPYAGFSLYKSTLSGDGALWYDAANNPAEIYGYTLVDRRSPRYMRGNNDVLQTFGLVLEGDTINNQHPLTRMLLANGILHRPNDTTDLQIKDAPLDTTPGRTPFYAGRREYRAIDIVFRDCTGAFEYDSTLTGPNGTGRAGIFDRDTTSGSYAAGTATGRMSFEVLTGSYSIGETITHDKSGATAVINSITHGASETITRFANTSACTATFRPQTGSAAIGDADMGSPIPVDDIWGAIRPRVSKGDKRNPSRGASEPI